MHAWCVSSRSVSSPALHAAASSGSPPDGPLVDAPLDVADDAALDAYVAECPALGEHWVRRVDAQDGRVLLFDVAHGPANEVAIAGSGDGFIDFCTGPLADTDDRSEDFLVAKYSATGALVWARRFGSQVTSRAYAVAVDSTGAVWASGLRRHD